RQSYFKKLDDARTLASSLAAGARFRDSKVETRAILIATPRTPYWLVARGMDVFDPRYYKHVEFLDPGEPERRMFRARPLEYPVNDALRGKAVVLGGDPNESIPDVPTLVFEETTVPESLESKKLADPSPVDKTVRLPLAPSAAVETGTFDATRVVVNLTSNGEIRCSGYQMSLRAVRIYAQAVMAANTHKDKPVTPRFLLRVDGDAPWLHVQYVLTELQRSGVALVEFAVRPRADASDSERDVVRFEVPRASDDKSAANTGYFAVGLRTLSRGSDPSALGGLGGYERHTLDIVAEREVEGRWGPAKKRTKVRRPLVVRFEWDGTRSYSMRDVIRSIVRTRAASLRSNTSTFFATKLRAVVSPSEKVPARFVIAAIARLKTMGWREVWFYRPTSPEDHLRGASFLPYPDSNRLLEVDDGHGDADDED
ncbi:MAG: ExbD/TolR family protein, partial [Planctomycetota bacterium]